jgi:hypothetical protein
VFPFVEQYRTPASIEWRTGRMSETTSVAISSDFSSAPLSKLTIADIVKTLFQGGAIPLLIRALFNPSDEEATRDGWGGLGRLIIGACEFGGMSVWGHARARRLTLDRRIQSAS